MLIVEYLGLAASGRGVEAPEDGALMRSADKVVPALVDGPVVSSILSAACAGDVDSVVDGSSRLLNGLAVVSDSITVVDEAVVEEAVVNEAVVNEAVVNEAVVNEAVVNEAVVVASVGENTFKYRLPVLFFVVVPESLLAFDAVVDATVVSVVAVVDEAAGAAVEDAAGAKASSAMHKIFPSDMRQSSPEGLKKPNSLKCAGSVPYTSRIGQDSSGAQTTRR